MADALTKRQLEILVALPSSAEEPASTMDLDAADCRVLWSVRLVSAITEDGRRRRTPAGDVLVATHAAAGEVREAFKLGVTSADEWRSGEREALDAGVSSDQIKRAYEQFVSAKLDAADFPNDRVADVQHLCLLSGALADEFVREAPDHVSHTARQMSVEQIRSLIHRLTTAQNIQAEGGDGS